MRLFQLIDANEGDPVKLFKVTRDSISETKVERLIIDNYNDEEFLHDFGIERVFVTNIYI